MTNLYQLRLDKMSDEELKEECERHGTRMEVGNVPLDEIERMRLCFKTAALRPGLNEYRDLFIVTLRVLRLL